MRMETTGTLNWVETARAAARTMRAGETVKTKKTASVDFPLVSAEPGGFRSLAETQDLEILHEKGLIIDIYL